ncbi:hypothetical protein SeLEV6574_g02418 [Synchytrium endobioticum]|uniref:Uncharacterized protein n=1 Tax=Synchytrium endobioticum TaxID=286115 RepID=A0A507D8P1_9FUNG|nr:hypothetical protein SeLEV6574_g02418 [Synchytrium endobioticum]
MHSLMSTKDVHLRPDWLRLHNVTRTGVASRATEANNTGTSFGKKLVFGSIGNVVRFNNVNLVDQLKVNAVGYFQPIAPNHASYDGFLWDSNQNSIIVLQSTVATDHPIHVAGLDSLLKAIKEAGYVEPPYPWSFVFCAPSDGDGVTFRQEFVDKGQAKWKLKCDQYILYIIVTTPQCVVVLDISPLTLMKPVKINGPSEDSAVSSFSSIRQHYIVMMNTFFVRLRQVMTAVSKFHPDAKQ